MSLIKNWDVIDILVFITGMIYATFGFLLCILHPIGIVVMCIGIYLIVLVYQETKRYV